MSDEPLFFNLEIFFFGFKDFGEKLGLPESVSQERLKSVIGRLLAVDELEYVDYRCYRVYDKFKTALINCTEVDERNKNFILGRLEGKTLENIAQ